MSSRKPKLLISAFVFLLIFSLIFQVSATESTPRASYYLNSYGSYIYNAAWGKIQVYFDVTATDYMDDIGTLSIILYESTDNENWSRVKTYTHDGTSGMLGQNKIYHSGHVDYSGTIGRYYKAYVCIWAGENGDGDTRYLWTNVQKATLFAG